MTDPELNEAEAPHPAVLSDVELLADCTMRRGRSSGPGGQHRNKVETHITLSHEPTGVTAQAGERRTPEDNKKVALGRLRLALAVTVRTSPSADVDGPSPLWMSRCRGGKVVVSPSHRDFPTLLAEALNVLADEGWEPRGAADRLGCSTSQLIKLVKQHPAAFQRLNRERQTLDRHPLK